MSTLRFIYNQHCMYIVYLKCVANSKKITMTLIFQIYI